MMGMHGEAWVNHAIQEADLLLALGMRFDDRVTGNLKTYAQDAKKIHIEIDPAEINKNVKVDVALVGDLREVLQELLPRVQSVDHSEWLDSIDKLKGDSAVRDIQNLPDNGHLYAAHVINDLWRETRNSNTVVVTDVGQHQMWEAQYFKHEKPRSLITSGGLGTMGFALPAAIGAKVARPESEVWVIVGDGGFQMTMSRTRDHSAGKAEDQHCDHQQRLPGHGAAVAGIFLRAQLRSHAAAESQFCETGRGLRHPQHGRDRALAGAADGAGGARARRRRADRLQGRAGRHRLSDGRGRCVVERHDPAAQSDRRNRRGRIKVKMLNIFVVYVENKPGVLTRVASLFRRRAFNIDSLTVGRTEKPEVSRMTITVDTNPDQAKRIEANLYNLVNVLLVENITHEPAIARDLAMIKVAATHEARSHVLELASVFRARVVDVAPESLTIEITGGEDKIDGLLEVLRPYGVVEMVRTGIVAMRRGTTSASANPAQTKAPEVAADEGVSYSV